MQMRSEERVEQFENRRLAVLVVLSKSQLRIDGVVREAQRCNGEKHWLVARREIADRPPRVTCDTPALG